jgi:hypothetical protein
MSFPLSFPEWAVRPIDFLVIGATIRVETGRGSLCTEVAPGAAAARAIPAEGATMPGDFVMSAPHIGQR